MEDDADTQVKLFAVRFGLYLEGYKNWELDDRSEVVNISVASVIVYRLTIRPVWSVSWRKDAFLWAGG